ncbi:hypothetical protein NMG60_11014771 [Bertholletia excelsa]
MAVSSTWIFSLKVLLISTGALSLAMMVKFSVPLILSFVLCQIPVIWSNFASYLRPPYLYFIINGIIITIVASSRFHYKLDEKQRNESEPLVSSRAPSAPDLSSDVAVAALPDFKAGDSPAASDSDEGRLAVKTLAMMDGSEADLEDEEETLVASSGSRSPPQRMDSTEIQTEFLMPSPEKPLVSSATARFGHRKPLKAAPEGGRALGVAKPKQQQHETLENTWKMITEGRSGPLTRQLKKSDTWQNRSRLIRNTALPDPPLKTMKKSSTFRDRTNYDPLPPADSFPSAGKLKREPSLGQDELNRRVEAFIKKFNEEMRLQREESLNRYFEMISRGAQ